MRSARFAFIPFHASVGKNNVVGAITRSVCFCPTMFICSRRMGSTSCYESKMPTDAQSDNAPELEHEMMTHDFLDPRNKEISCLSDNQPFSASLHGLEPRKNKFHQPIVHHPKYSFVEWPSDQQTFPMDKFYYLSKTLTSKMTHLPRPLVRTRSDFFQPLDSNEIPRAWFAQPDGPICPIFLDRFLSASLDRKEELRIGFRECCKLHGLRERTVLEVAGTILTAQLAWKHGLATNTAGGTHHASPDTGAGYTILNDLAVTANFLLKPELNNHTILGVKTVLVIDCDVHQGDGTAKFVNMIECNKNDVDSYDDGAVEDEQRQSFVTLSIHCESNYPSYKAHSTYDVGLPDKTGDDEYMDILKTTVNKVLKETKPDFVIYDAGVDVHKDDFLGRFSLSTKGIRERDRWVFEKCVSLGIPVAGVIGGGYDKNKEVLAERHAIVQEEASFVWRKYKMWSN
mmetsp:Transcript_28789/g.44017  ORF Transcript_28789/g.44017 Transcript_28789/m.44017 type:complete len:456 (+) Transcript_28789:26-1393(+)